MLLGLNPAALQRRWNLRMEEVEGAVDPAGVFCPLLVSIGAAFSAAVQEVRQCVMKDEELYSQMRRCEHYAVVV